MRLERDQADQQQDADRRRPSPRGPQLGRRRLHRHPTSLRSQPGCRSSRLSMSITAGDQLVHAGVSGLTIGVSRPMNTSHCSSSSWSSWWWSPLIAVAVSAMLRKRTVGPAARGVRSGVRADHAGVRRPARGRGRSAPAREAAARRSSSVSSTSASAPSTGSAGTPCSASSSTTRAAPSGKADRLVVDVMSARGLPGRGHRPSRRRPVRRLPGDHPAVPGGAGDLPVARGGPGGHRGPAQRRDVATGRW